MLIRRYLLREVLQTFFAVILVILLIAVCNRFVRLIGKAASGDIAPNVLFQVFLLQIPELLALLLPVGLFLAILLCYSRFFADNEIPAMFACGISWQRLLGVGIFLGVVVMLISGSLTCYFGPQVAQHREQLLNKDGPLLLIQTITPGRFHAFQHDKFVFYMAEANSDRTKLKKVFVAEQPKMNSSKQDWSLLTAKTGEIISKDKKQQTYLQLAEGQRYHGKPGNKNYSILQFEEYQRLIEGASIPEGVFFHRTMPTKMLWENQSLGNLAELQWRLSIPLSALLLALLAVPLSKVSPRSGRFGRLFIAVIICILYYNLLTISKRWVSGGVLPPFIGVWWVHGVFLILTAAFFAKASGRWAQWMGAKA